MFLIKINSNSLGDNIAAMHVIERFRNIKTPGERIGVIADKTEYYGKSYPEFDFHSKKEFDFHEREKADFHKLDDKWILNDIVYDDYQGITFRFYEGLIEGIARQLGVTDSNLLNKYPKIDYYNPEIEREKLITFSMHSTAQLKHWNYPNGWKILTNKLKKAGYKVANVDFHESWGYGNNMDQVPDNCIKCNGLSIRETSELINKSELFIGLSSGLSWVAHALHTPVVMISGMTKLEYEFKHSILRIGAQSKCRDCFSSRQYHFPNNDWLWCPVYKGTEKAFECSSSITPDHVFDSIMIWLESGKKSIFI